MDNTTQQAEIVNVTVGQIVRGRFLARDLYVRETKNGSKYLAGVLQDKTGVMTLRKWDLPQFMISNCPINGVYDVSFSVESFNDELQAKVTDFRFVSDKQELIMDYMVHFLQDDIILSYVKNMKELINRVTNVKLKNFVVKIFTDLGLYGTDDEIIKSPFCLTTAAKSNHHVGVGGLLAHSYTTAVRAYTASTAYKDANSDLCIVGGLLHDIGKMKAYQWVDGGPDLSTAGYMIGHTVLGMQYIQDYKDLISDDMFTLVSHIIASHHGRVEFNAVMEPMTLEAQIVSDADMGDFLLECARVNDESDNSTKNITRLTNKPFMTPKFVKRIMDADTTGNLTN